MGGDEGIPDRLAPEHEAEFPNLIKAGYAVTSRRSDRYNCVAYAAGDPARKWTPIGNYWPKGAKKSSKMDGLVSAFEMLGYEKCAGDHVEDGFDKVALYVDHLENWTHASIQLADGSWSSKLGAFEDIRHKTPYALNSNIYGQVMYFMRRAKKDEKVQ